MGDLGYVTADDSVHEFIPDGGRTRREIWDIRFDDSGTMWVSTRAGTGLHSYHDGIWSTFSRSSGLNNLQLWPVLPTRNRVLVGTNGSGVGILDLREAGNPKPRVVLAPPLIDADNATIRWQAFAWWGELAPREIATRFRLDAEPWSDWTIQREVLLKGLTAGEHAVYVQAKNLFGYYDSLPHRSSFVIAAPFYLRPSFALPVVILLAAVTVLAFQIAARKRKYTAELHAREAQLRTVTDMTASAILISQGPRICFANPGAERLTGFGKDRLLTMAPSEIVHPDHREFVKDTETPSSDAFTFPRRGEFRSLTGNGEERWVDITVGQIEFQGRPAILWTAFDITTRKNAEKKLLAYQEELQSLATELSVVEERERHRMAEYLHDSISQGLAFCKMKLAALTHAHTRQEKAELVQEITALIDQSIEHAQNLTFDLSPPVLHELGFEEAVAWLAERMQVQHGVPVAFEDDRLPKPLADNIRVVLFQAVKEALVNVVKHAGACRAGVRLRRDNDAIEIVVHDDGAGFDPSSLVHGRRTGGFGLFNIRERIARLGGRFDVDSSTGGGTRVVLTSPLLHGAVATQGGHPDK
jgi:PAS domain S-box-containing protein